MRTTLCLAALALLALAAPLASAQTPLQSATLQVSLGTFEEPFRTDFLYRADSKIEFSATGLASMNMNGIKARLVIEEAPDWASVTLSPSELTLYTNQQSNVVYVTEPFAVLAILRPGAPPGESATIRVSACTDGTSWTESACGTDTTPILVASGNEPCHHDVAAEAPETVAPEPEEPAKDEELALPEDGNIPVAIGALGAAGGLLGLVARVAWVRQKR